MRPHVHVYDEVQECKEDMAEETRSSHSLPLFEGSMYIRGCGFHVLDDIYAVEAKTEIQKTCWFAVPVVQHCVSWHLHGKHVKIEA